MLRAKIRKIIIDNTNDFNDFNDFNDASLLVITDQLEALFNSNLKEQRALLKEIDYWAETVDVEKQFEDLTHFENGFDYFRQRLQAKLKDIATNTLEVKV